MLSTNIGHHFFGAPPTITDNRISTLLQPKRDHISRENYYSDSYYIVKSTNWRCCVGECSSKVFLVKMALKKGSGKTEFENFRKHLKTYHRYHLSGDDFLKEYLENSATSNSPGAVMTPLHGIKCFLQTEDSEVVQVDKSKRARIAVTSARCKNSVQHTAYSI